MSDYNSNKEEAAYLREKLFSPPPKSYNVPIGMSVPPFPKPCKLRRERADDIVECAMRLMDLAMDQNRMIKRLESVIEDIYTDKE